MSAILTEQNAYAARFSEVVGRLPGRGLPWIDRLRRTGMERFVELGFPSTRLEDWKYTNVAPISRLTLQPVLERSNTSVKLDLFPSPRLVFVDGVLCERPPAAFGGSPPLQGGELCPPCKGERPRSGRGSLTQSREPYMASLSDSLADPKLAALLECHLGRYADTLNHSFVAWNTAFFADGACVVIPEQTIVPQPIHLVFVSTSAKEPRAVFPRNLIVVGEGSHVALIEAFISESDGVYLTNAVTEVVAGAGAMIDYYKVERESHNSFHVAILKAVLARDATLTSHSFSFGAELARNELRVALDGEGSHCTLDGLFLADTHRLVDNHTEIDHRKPHATSRELYKGILRGHGEGVFNGAIIVRKDAQKTDAVQHNRNLLLSEDAQINTKPQLEIRADDVRCAHGASIGQIDQEALFYLKSRGVDERTARQILIRGFAREILDGIRLSDVRQQLERLLDEWFEGNLEEA